jgi:oxygen-independent coproporphyrinogen III oxidase
LAGIYIHIPFCKQACNYCNFHFSTSLKNKAEMIAAIVKEIQLTNLFTTNNATQKIQTLYFGGGTPSLLTKVDLQLIFDALQTKFYFSEAIEITLEANPDNINEVTLNEWKNIGINRLSVGVQSFLDEELIWMNRAHNATHSLQCIDKIIAAGFTNFSIDLIYGSPMLNNDNWKKNVSILLEKNVPHLSCYALTVEPKTALHKMIATKQKNNIDADKQTEQYNLLMYWMQQAGYEHYEISSFAKKGMRSKHNSNYWSGEKYYGFGPSAHSFDEEKRRWNVSNNALYIKSLQNNTIPFEEETLTQVHHVNEYIMTALRTIEGINLEKVTQKFGQKFSNDIYTNSKKYIVQEKIIVDNNFIFLTNEGKHFADGIAADLFF